MRHLPTRKVLCFFCFLSLSLSLSGSLLVLQGSLWSELLSDASSLLDCLRPSQIKSPPRGKFHVWHFCIKTNDALPTFFNYMSELPQPPPENFCCICNPDSFSFCASARTKLRYVPRGMASWQRQNSALILRTLVKVSTGASPLHSRFLRASISSLIC